MSDLKKENITLSKNVATSDDLDYSFLREKGIEYIEQLSGNIWTDYNTHDPGVTILEMLCYAITDLGARINLPIQNILQPGNNAGTIEDQFYKAGNILPSKPLTGADYRKLFIDIDGVKNCWLKPFKKTVYVNLKNDKLSYNPEDFNPVDISHKTTFDLQGLNTIVVDFDEPDEKEFPTPAEQKAEIERIKTEITNLYHQNRNLCEDLVEVKKVETHPVAVCAKIELHPEADEELVHAKVLRTIDNYFSPDLKFYSLNQMLQKNYTTDEIFEGPLLKNGFIDPEELENATLREEVRLSDITGLIMNIEGVKVITEISVVDCKKPDNEEDEWLICIEDGKKPVRCELSAFSYYKGVLPVNVNSKKVRDYLNKLEKEEKEKQELAKVGMEPEIPKGIFLDPGNTTTIQNDFPDTYGINKSGLPANSTDARKAQARQLKGYLLFFDQIFANYFAHLEKVKEMLSVNNQLSKTYFTQVVQDVRDFKELINDYSLYDNDELANEIIGNLDNHRDRKNKILDHLIARFAEKFSEYSFLMKELYGSQSDRIIIRSKETFLSEYGEVLNNSGEVINRGISNWRGSAFNYFEQTEENLWDTENVAGVQKRITRLCGMKDYTRRNLSQSSAELLSLTDSGGKTVYRWRIRNSVDEILITSIKNFKTPRLAENDLYQAVLKIIQSDSKSVQDAFNTDITDGKTIESFEIKHPSENNYSYLLIDVDADPKSADRLIARQYNNSSTPEDLQNAILHLIGFLTGTFTEEGMFLVEHILLRPDITGESVTMDQFMPICTKGENACQPVDPYSFRVTVVLPGWTYRFGNCDFRNFMEELIRKELPAHILARICWIGNRKNSVPDNKNDMIKFENDFKKFLFTKTNAGQSQNITKLKKLIKTLTELNSIYPTGRLIDCDDEEESLEGRIVLGRTNIGNL